MNSDLVGKYINIASRAAGFLTKYFEGFLLDDFPGRRLFDLSKSAGLKAAGSELPAPHELGHAAHIGGREPFDIFAVFLEQSVSIARLYEERDFAKALREIMLLADVANRYIDEQAPWKLAKDKSQLARLHQVCTVAVQLFRLLTLYLKPVLPALALNVEAFLKIGPLTWEDAATPLPAGHAIGDYKHLMQRVDAKVLDQLFESNQPAVAVPAAQAAVEPVATDATLPGGEAIAPTITIDDFVKIDLRLAKIVDCQKVEGSKKLLQLTLDAGEGTDPQGSPILRNVFSGIASAYEPEQLVGKLTVLVANLAPRKMKFGISEGMVLAASHADEKANPGIHVLEPSPGAMPGMRVR